MLIHFYKYHGTGNDFVLIDNRAEKVMLTTEQIAFLCHRRFGIGADGLMLLEEAGGYDFRMVYYNADGGESTMCGNGGRCITAFAQSLGLIGDTANFLAIDGPHSSLIHMDGLISLHMQDVKDIRIHDAYTLLDTGSPHYVQFVADVNDVDVFNDGRTIRNLPAFQPNGVNVNFVQRMDGKIAVRTYERGVEDETLSCGTGVTASAIAATGTATGKFIANIETPGGRLEVSFVKDSSLAAVDVILKGPAAFVFKGEIELL